MSTYISIKKSLHIKKASSKGGFTKIQQEIFHGVTKEGLSMLHSVDGTSHERICIFHILNLMRFLFNLGYLHTKVHNVSHRVEFYSLQDNHYAAQVLNFPVGS